MHVLQAGRVTVTPFCSRPALTTLLQCRAFWPPLTGGFRGRTLEKPARILVWVGEYLLKFDLRGGGRKPPRIVI